MSNLMRQPPIRSPKYISSANGQPCTLCIVGVCTGDTETTVFAHIRDDHTGRSQKASDTSGADACKDCHTIFDGTEGRTLSRDDWMFYALRGLQRTYENRVRRGIAVIPLQLKKPSANRSKRSAPKKPTARSRQSLFKRQVNGTVVRRDQ